MSHQSIDDLPPSARRYLPSHTQEVFEAALHGAWAEHVGDARQEEKVFRIAWAAVALRPPAQGHRHRHQSKLRRLAHQELPWLCLPIAPRAEGLAEKTPPLPPSLPSVSYGRETVMTSGLTPPPLYLPENFSVSVEKTGGRAHAHIRALHPVIVFQLRRTKPVKTLKAVFLLLPHVDLTLKRNNLIDFIYTLKRNNKTSPS